MKQLSYFLTFTVADTSCALRLPTVERVILAVDIIPLPQAPEVILGVINIHGKIAPVADVRKRFKFPNKEISLKDHIIIVNSSKQRLCLLVDNVTGVIQRSEDELLPENAILPSKGSMDGIATFNDATILIQDLTKFLSLHEEKVLAGALEGVTK
ncbi:MAG: chemotaxis protein CheW [Bdellovibrionia bacterium]